MNLARLSKPAIAGICAGGLVVYTLIILLVLKLAGFLRSEQVPQREAEKVESPLEKGIKLMQYRDLLKKWCDEELPELFSTDPTASERIIDALTPIFDSLLKKAEGFKSDRQELFFPYGDFLAYDDILKKTGEDLSKQHGSGKTFLKQDETKASTF